MLSREKTDWLESHTTRGTRFATTAWNMLNVPDTLRYQERLALERDPRELDRRMI